MDIIKNFIYNSYLKSLQSKILLLIAAISIIISMQFNYNSVKTILYQLFFYIYIAYVCNCFVYGNCDIDAWLIIIIPILTNIIIILNNYSYFDNLKIKLEQLKKDIGIFSKHNINI